MGWFNYKNKLTPVRFWKRAEACRRTTKVSLAQKSLNRQGGYTLIELLVVIAIIGILSTSILAALNKGRDKAEFARAQKEFRTMAQALELYLIDNVDYPEDVNRGLPPGLEPYLGPGQWPGAPWSGSVYDWDNWTDPDDSSKRIIQVSIRFCPIGEPQNCNFPNEDWAEDFDINSSVYYCFEGSCRSHINEPINHPGYCINCGQL